MDVVHVTVGPRRSRPRDCSQSDARLDRVPIPPVVFGVRFLVVAVVLFRFLQKFSKISYV